MTRNVESSPKFAGTFQIVVFRLGSEEYAVSIDQIKEVVITPEYTRMPQSPPHVRGVANVRGNIISIIDLEVRFGLKSPDSRDDAQARYTLVVESDEYKMGILVKDVPNTLAISGSQVEETVISGSDDQNYIRGIVKLGNRLIILVDIIRLLAGKEQPVIQMN